MILGTDDFETELDLAMEDALSHGEGFLMVDFNGKCWRMKFDDLVAYVEVKLKMKEAKKV